jgi:serine/threonine protein kinase
VPTLLTGRGPFHGEDLTDTLASVMKENPDLNRVPVQVRPLLESCLEKDPKKRLRDIGDAWRLLQKDLDSPQSAQTVASPEVDLGTAFDGSPDGQFAVVESSRGLAALTLGPHSTSRQLTNGAQDAFPRFSPDGKRLAYHSRESDKNEVFVQDFPAGRTRIQVSNQGGVVPLWRGDQKELSI